MFRLIMISGIFSLIVGGFAPHALAWGVCARGPWVGAPAIDRGRAEVSGGTSTCRCSSGQVGSVAVTSHENAVLNNSGGGWRSETGFEWQGHDLAGKKINFPGASYSAGYHPLHTGAWTKQAIYHWPWEEIYSWTGFYRAVCLSSTIGLEYNEDHAWMYDQ